MPFGGEVTVYCENHAKYTLGWWNAEYVKAGDTYSNHWSLKVNVIQPLAVR
jgi:hypothetical protein